MRNLADLCENPKFLAAIQRLRNSRATLTEAKRDFRGWLRRQGVTVPSGVAVRIYSGRARNLLSTGIADDGAFASINSDFIPTSRVTGHKQMGAVAAAAAVCVVAAGVYVVASNGGADALETLTDALSGSSEGDGDDGKGKGGKKGGKDRGGKGGGGTTDGGTTG